MDNQTIIDHVYSTPMTPTATFTDIPGVPVLDLLRNWLILTFLTLTPSLHAGELNKLVAQRLEVMREVAAYKWLAEIPIENLDREAVVLDNAVNSGLRLGLTIDSSRGFFAAQIDAAKAIQSHWVKQWNSNPASAPASAVDLDGSIRPQLLSLGDSIVAALAAGDRIITPGSIAGLEQDDWEKLQAAAAAVETYPNQLQQVLGSKVLRVGTTADYPPFTATDKQDQRLGIDIDLASDLAASLGAQIHWVHTSWPTLMVDHAAGNFDIAMSGISINLDRSRTAYFSTPYYRGGKTPIIRCADRQLFSSLEAIDSPETRVIVNPGGTNQRYVDTHIERASVRVHEDNRSIFTELVEGRADVMFTDQIEVRWQAARLPQLCPALPGETLTFSEKGFLLPQDAVWKNYIDTWLHIRQGNGFLTRIFEQHLQPR